MILPVVGSTAMVGPLLAGQHLIAKECGGVGLYLEDTWLATIGRREGLV